MASEKSFPHLLLHPLALTKLANMEAQTGYAPKRNGAVKGHASLGRAALRNLWNGAGVCLFFYADCRAFSRNVSR